MKSLKSPAEFAQEEEMIILIGTDGCFNADELPESKHFF